MSPGFVLLSFCDAKTRVLRLRDAYVSVSHLVDGAQAVARVIEPRMLLTLPREIGLGLYSGIVGMGGGAGNAVRPANICDCT